MTEALLTHRSDLRPSIDELRVIAQPPSTMGRFSGEHWAGRLYMRRASIRLTRLLTTTSVTPNSLTWAMLGCGLLAVVTLTVPRVWAAVVALLLVQLQGLLDCSDGELARWRGVTSPMGVYVDRLGHYVTDAGLAVAVGVAASGGLGSIDGWTTIGLAAGFLSLLSKAETDLVHVARAQSGKLPAADTLGASTSRAGGIRRLRSALRSLPFNRMLIAIELTWVALVVAIIDAATGSLTAMRGLDLALLAAAGIVVVGHLLTIVTSEKLR
jgi:phosphatidylglycerophosphate synthase